MKRPRKKTRRPKKFDLSTGLKAAFAGTYKRAADRALTGLFGIFRSETTGVLAICRAVIKAAELPGTAELSALLRATADVMDSEAGSVVENYGYPQVLPFPVKKWKKAKR